MSEVSPPASRGAWWALEAGMLTDDERVAWAVDGLRFDDPEASAYRVLTRPQKIVGIVLLVLIVAGIVVNPTATGLVLISLVTVVYAGTIGLRLWLLSGDREKAAVHRYTYQELHAVADEDLPTYSILVPAYREPEVMPIIIHSLAELDYPQDKVEILLVLEADDTETIEAAYAAGMPPNARVVPVPPSEPRTKPKACNYALLEATGDILTIYDAEDLPEPLQLRKAAITLMQNPRLGCVQGELNYFNPNQNLLTQWFTIEYTAWFQEFLPGMVRSGAPLPLGGTSNHIRRSLLLRLHGWDPYNVTEDADLGIRLHRAGYRTGVIDSVTLEEANSDVVNWVKQRSRWYKGYLQTWLVQMRHPMAVLRDFGPGGFTIFNLFVGGTPLLAIINPLFWSVLVVWFLFQPHMIQVLYPAPILYTSMVCWLLGNFLLVYGFFITGLRRTDLHLLKACLLFPVYFVLMSMAAYKALFQLLGTSHFWEKTTHGLAADHGPHAVTASTAGAKPAGGSS